MPACPTTAHRLAFGVSARIAKVGNHRHASAVFDEFGLSKYVM